jgi:hypothetical protein
MVEWWIHSFELTSNFYIKFTVIHYKKRLSIILLVIGINLNQTFFILLIIFK